MISAPRQIGGVVVWAMTMLHCVNCTALTFVPLWIVYKCTSLGEGGKIPGLVSTGIAHVGAQLIMMILLASFIPDMENQNFDLTQEFMKVVIGMLEILAMSLAYNFALRGERTEKVLSLGVGWAIVESALSRLLPILFGARELEFEWSYLVMGIEGNLSILVFIAFARLISRCSIKNDDSVSKASFRRILIIFALVHGTIGTRGPTIFRVGPAVALVLRVVWSLGLYAAAHVMFASRPSSSKAATTTATRRGSAS